MHQNLPDYRQSRLYYDGEFEIYIDSHYIHRYPFFNVKNQTNNGWTRKTWGELTGKQKAIVYTYRNNPQDISRSHIAQSPDRYRHFKWPKFTCPSGTADLSDKPKYLLRKLNCSSCKHLSKRGRNGCPQGVFYEERRLQVNISETFELNVLS